MLIVTRQLEARYDPPTGRHVPKETRAYICDYRDADGVKCGSAQVEGNAPEDKGVLPRGWSSRWDPALGQNDRAPIYCPLHDTAAIAGRELVWRSDEVAMPRVAPDESRELDNAGATRRR